MGNIFAASEIVELGIEIEKNGRDFYNILTKQSRHKKSAEQFKFLAEAEEEHILVFQRLLDSVQKYKSVESYQGEYAAYMRALAREHVFTKQGKGKAIAKSIKSDKEAVELGISFEKDSIIFYEGMKKIGILEGDVKVLDELIAQEEDHLTLLSDLKGKL